MSSARFWLFSPIFSVMEENGFKYTMFALSSLCRLIQHSSTFFLVKTLSLTVFLCVTYRRQWHLCHVIPLNKGESTGIVEANYSLPKVRSPGKKLRLDNLKLELVKNRHFATPNLIVACVSQEILHLAPSFFTGLRFHHRKAKKPRGRCPYYSNSCASRQLLLQGGDILVNPGPPVLKPSAPRYSSCEKPVAKNHKRCICSVCFDVTNAKC